MYKHVLYRQVYTSAETYRGTPVSGPTIVDWHVIDHCYVGSVLEVLSGDISSLSTHEGTHHVIRRYTVCTQHVAMH